MTACRDFQDQLPFYLEDLLSAEEKDRLEEHLAACALCRQSLADLKKTENLLKDLKEVETPPFFEERIMARVREETEKKKSLLQKLFFPIRIKVPVQALATVLVAVLAVYLYRQNEPEIKPNLIPPSSFHEPAKGSGPTSVPLAPQGPKSASPVKPAPESDLFKKEPSMFAPAPPTPDIRDSARKDNATGPIEEQKPAIEKYGTSIRAKKDKEEFSNRLSAFNRGSERMEKQEAGSSLETSRLERKGERVLAPKKAIVREEKLGLSSSPAPSKLEKAGIETRTPLEMIILAKEMDQAVGEIEKRLQRTGARIIENRPSEGKIFLKTEIAAPQIDLFLENLGVIGKIIFNQKTLEGREGKVILNIQILTYTVQ